jgi:hypothetical protein
MEEGTSSSKAIPLRRSRAASRAVALRTPRLNEAITAGVRYVLEPSHQLWLAGLGGAALAVRGARAAWSRMVAEGAQVESRLRHTLGSEVKAENG